MFVSLRDENSESYRSSRTGQPILRAREEISSVWLEVSRRVYASLRRRGVPHETAEDIVQDVALRLLDKNIEFVNGPDLARFAHRVAHDLSIDVRRRANRRQTTPSAEVDRDCADDAEAVVESLTARRAWTLLPRVDQVALLAADERPASSVEYGRRFRARARLAGILASLEGWLVWLLRKVRRPAPRLALASVTVAALWIVLECATPPAAPDRSHTGDTSAGGAEHAPYDRAVFTQPNASTLAPATGVAAQPVYRERVSLPARRVVIGPGDEGVFNGGTAPTTHDDAVVCVGGFRYVPDLCLGKAMSPLKL